MMSDLAERVRTPLFRGEPLKASELDLSSQEHLKQLYDNWDRNKLAFEAHWLRKNLAKERLVIKSVKERLSEIVADP